MGAPGRHECSHRVAVFKIAAQGVDRVERDRATSVSQEEQQQILYQKRVIPGLYPVGC